MSRSIKDPNMIVAILFFSVAAFEAYHLANPSTKMGPAKQS